MGALLKAVGVALAGMALQAFIRFSSLRSYMVARREEWLIFLLIIVLLLVASSLVMLSRQKLLFVYRTRHFWRFSDHHKK